MKAEYEDLAQAVIEVANRQTRNVAPRVERYRVAKTSPLRLDGIDSDETLNERDDDVEIYGDGDALDVDDVVPVLHEDDAYVVLVPGGKGGGGGGGYYEQPGEPGSSAKDGAIWVDTDAPAPGGPDAYEFDVVDYGGALGQPHDDSAAFQACIAAAEALGGGTVTVPPIAQGYTYATTLEFHPINQRSQVTFVATGAVIVYTGSGDAMVIHTNIQDVDIQHAERTVNFEGLHLYGTAAATAGLRLDGCCRCSFRNTCLEGFRNTTVGAAAVILDAHYHHWVEECHFDGLEIKDTGHGICFISREDVGPIASSCENNVFTATHIWISQTGGRGVYGIGMGTTTHLAILARCVFNSIIIHPQNVSDVIAFDLRECYIEGLVLIAPSVDVFGTCPNLTFIWHTHREVLTVLGPTIFPLSGVTYDYRGGGRYVITGGNGPSDFSVDARGNVVTPYLTIMEWISDRNGAPLIGQNPILGASNYLKIQNGGGGQPVLLFPDGTVDADVEMRIAGKGSGKVRFMSQAQYDEDVTAKKKLVVGTSIHDRDGNVLIGQTPQAFAVNYVTVQNGAAGSGPWMYPTGPDTNLDMTIAAKAGGVVSLVNDVKVGGKFGVGVAPVARPNVSGAKGGNTALASLLAALVSMGLISDTTGA